MNDKKHLQNNFLLSYPTPLRAFFSSFYTTSGLQKKQDRCSGSEHTLLVLQGFAPIVTLFKKMFVLDFHENFLFGSASNSSVFFLIFYFVL